MLHVTFAFGFAILIRVAGFLQQQLASFSPDGSTIAQGELPQLPLPVVDSNDTKVLCVRMPRSEEGKRRACLHVVLRGEIRIFMLQAFNQ